MDKKDLINKLEKEGFSDKIISAFEKVHREKFIPEEFKDQVYEDIAVSIGEGQTISQPYTVAFMLSLLDLKEGNKIMEVGSGSGYVLALMSEMFPNNNIYGVERIKHLVEKSQIVLKDYKNVKVIFRDGSQGLEEYAPFDSVLVSASAEGIPDKLIEQLSINGILVIPVKDSIIKVTKKPEGIERKEFSGFRFVPLIED
tara:strand:- start:35 stop:631 length:597 start_codon:yes stop_codon:yes gene_type:complete